MSLGSFPTFEGTMANIKQASDELKTQFDAEMHVPYAITGPFKLTYVH